MLFEWRTYRFGPGRAVAYLEAFRDEGLALVTRHLPLLGYWLTECGRLNVLHHLWAYESLAHRAACRAALGQDPAWTAGFGPRAFPMIEGQESWLLAMAAASPALDAALDGLGAVRQPRPGPLLAPSWAMLEVGEAPPAGPDTVACWRVVAGEGAGAAGFALTRWDAAPDAAALSGAAVRQRELLRPCSFSPLR